VHGKDRPSFPVGMKIESFTLSTSHQFEKLDIPLKAKRDAKYSH